MGFVIVLSKGQFEGDSKRDIECRIVEFSGLALSVRFAWAVHPWGAKHDKSF